MTGRHSGRWWFRVFLRPYFGLADVADRLSFGFDAGGLTALRTATRSVRQDLGEWDLRPDARHVGAATLVIAGEASIFPARAPLELHASLRRSRLETLPGVGHFPFLEAPRTFQSLVSRFLSGAD